VFCFARFLMVLIVLSILTGCSGDKTPTPPTVTAHFHALLDSLDEAPPGAAVARLESFSRAHLDYEIADSVQAEIVQVRVAAKGRYHEARELARRGEFDQAELILLDLAQHLSDTRDGESARRDLEFDFFFGKAQWHLIRQQHEECEAVASKLLEFDLTSYQASQVEMLLDRAGDVDAAFSQVERANARSACRHLTIMLVQQYVDEGRYPSSLSIADIASWGPQESEFILRSLSSIEDYETFENSYSFTGVSSKGHHRVRVVDGQVMD
jgi:hypothetical protein